MRTAERPQTDTRLMHTPEDRLDLAERAGLETVSATSILAGTFTAFGVLLVAVGLATGIAGALDVDFAGFSDGQWREIGIGGGAILAFSVLLGFLFGGYTAGRMSARRGARHGFWVLILSMVVIGIAAVFTNNLTDTATIGDELRQEGIPTGADTWTDIGIGVGIAVFVMMVVGSLLGGWAGERWHDRVYRWAADRDMSGRSEQRRTDDVPSRTVTKTADGNGNGERRNEDGEAMEFSSMDTSGDGRTERLDADGDGESKTVDLREERTSRR